MQETHKNNNNFLGLNMKGFFKGCACVGGGEDHKSHSSISDQRRPMLNKKQYDQLEDHSAYSNADWTDLEEMQVIPDGNGGMEFNPDQFIGYDNYETLEPIDFDRKHPLYL